MGIVLFVAGVFSLFMIRDLFNKNILVGFFFAFLQVYNYVPFAARCYDNSLVNLVSHIQIFDEDILYKYLFYCYAQSIVLYLLFKNYVLKGKPILLNRNSVWNVRIRRNIICYNIIQIIVALILFYNLTKYYSLLNYHDQVVVKSNLIWVILLEYSFVFFLIDFFLYKKERKLIPVLCGLFIAIPTCLTLFKIGNRGIAMPALCGYLYLILINKNFKISIKQIKTTFIAFLCILPIIMFSQFIRSNRGSSSTSYNFSLNMIEDFFDIKVLLFQDYTIPGNSLMYCIDKNIIDPIFVCLSNIGNCIFFYYYPTIAIDISDRINTGEVFGVGGFLPVEGFYLTKLSFPKEKEYSLFIGFLLCTFLCFNLARGQSYLLFKVLYMYIIPSCILYRLAFGSKNIQKYG